MHNTVFVPPKSCTGCSACVNSCPRECLIFKYDATGFRYPQLSSFTQCIQCDLCKRVCPEGNPKPIERDSSKCPPRAYMYINRDLQIREASTSGGAYTFLAQQVLSCGGLVFGCRYNPETHEVEYDDSDHCDFEVFRKSKYVEANPGKTFLRVKQAISHGRLTLFCGTPCHVAGLKKYLKELSGSSYLLLADFRCHGVPSNALFAQYVARYETEKNKVTEIDFRYKDFSRSGIFWHDIYLCLKYANGNRRLVEKNESMFYRGFYDNILLRKSCYSCTQFEHSVADISLADFWGISRFSPEKDDNKGISLVCFHTSRARAFWDGCKNIEDFTMIPWSAAEYLFKPRDMSVAAKRNRQYEDWLRKYGYWKTMRKIYGYSCEINKLKRIIKQAIGYKKA